MPRSFFRFSLPVLLVFLFPYSVLAQRPGSGRPSGGTISVTVRYADGRPAPRGIHVRLEHAEGGAEGDLETKDGGKCEFHQSTSGVYIVRIDERDYKEVSARVEIIGNPMAYVVLELVPLKPETNKEDSAVAVTLPESVSVADLGVPEPARQEFDKGEEAFRAKNLQESLKHYQKAVSVYPNFPTAYRRMGQVYMESKDWPNAEASLKKSVELNPKLAASYIDLGAIQNQQKNYDAAVDYLKKGLDLSPDAAEGKYELAKSYWALGRWQSAAPLAEDTVAALPDLASAHVLLANIRLRQRNAVGALHEYQEYLRIEPEGSLAPQVKDMVAKLQKALQQSQP